MTTKTKFIKFNKRNSLIFCLLFIIEALIAIYFKKGFIRNIFGDYLVVIMLYYFISSFINYKATYIALLTLFIAYLVEFLQFINICDILNIEKNTITKLILGTTYSTHDIIAYTLGFLTILFIEKLTKFVVF